MDVNCLSIKGLSEYSIAKGNLSGSKHILISRSSTGADDMYIAYDLFIIPPILRSTSHTSGKHTHYCNMYFQYTLLADVFHSSSQLILKELTFLCNLFSFLQEVLGGSLHRRRQNMSLLGASFLLVRWAFVAGVDQSGDLWQGYKWFNNRDCCFRISGVFSTTVMPTAFYDKKNIVLLYFQQMLVISLEM